MYSIGFTITPLGSKNKLQFVDISTNPDTEVIESRVVTITKSDLSETSFPFAPTDTQLIIESLDKDYALTLDFVVVTNVNTYQKRVKFVTLDYAAYAKTKRIDHLEKNGHNIVNRELYKKNTLDINYYMMVANDRISYGDMIGAQKALDFIADLVDREPNKLLGYVQ